MARNTTILCPSCQAKGRVHMILQEPDGWCLCRECGLHAIGWKDYARQIEGIFRGVMERRKMRVAS